MLAGYEIECTPPIFETEILICQSKAIVDATILFGKITHLLDLEISKILVRSINGNENSTFDLGS